MKNKKILVLSGMLLSILLCFVGCSGEETTSSKNKAENTNMNNIISNSYLYSSNSATSEVNKNINTTSSSNTTNTELTIGQKNALKSAKSYLEYSSFSYKGLVEQLEYEGYSKEEATYAVDNCGADWKEQAAKTAKSYIEYSSFSRKSLLEQLKYEGFTSEEAEYGVTSVGY